MAESNIITKRKAGSGSVKNRLPAHAKKFKGRAKRIPAEATRWLPYQWRFITDESHMILVEKARRIGMTFANSYRKARRHSIKSHELDSYVSSRDQRDSRLFVKHVGAESRKIDQAAEILTGGYVLDVGGKPIKIDSIDYGNGTTLHSLSGDADAFAGKGGDVDLDEHAVKRRPKDSYAIAEACIEWGGGRMTSISTHRGKKNYFNVLCREAMDKGNPKRWSHHRISLEDALDQFLLWKLQSMMPAGDARLEMDEAEYFDYIRDRAASEATFQQERMINPEDDENAFISYALLTPCQYLGGEIWELSIEELKACSNRLYGGLDIGRQKDLTSLWINEVVGGVHFTRFRIDLGKSEDKPDGFSFTEQENILWKYFEICDRTCIDNTGLGMQFAERATERFGTSKIESVTFTNKNKSSMAHNGKKILRERLARVPFDDLVESDFLKLRKETTAAGNERFVVGVTADDVPEDKSLAELDDPSHADRFWAWALALNAADVKDGGYHAELID